MTIFPRECDDGKLSAGGESGKPFWEVLGSINRLVEQQTSVLTIYRFA